VYKDNRVVVREVVNGDQCHIDKSAIHVGKLDKAQETEKTLFERFGKYGPIVSSQCLPIA
jgi:hypothetical protein